MKKLLIIGMLLFVASFSLLSAAIVDYYQAPVASAGTYTAIAGTQAGATGDDTISAVLPLGFTFNYCGVAYTQVKMCTNGWLLVGSTSPGSTWTNQLVSTTYNPIIAPLWDDLGSSSLAVMTYTTSGAAGSQVFTAQWADANWQVGGTALANFQVKIYEGSDKIELIYGVMPAAPYLPSASIGINCAPGGSGNYYSITPGSPIAYSTTTENNTIAASTFLTTGTTYTFVKATVGSVPSAANVVSPLNTATGVLQTASMNWSAGAGIPTGYKLQYGTNPAADNLMALTNLGLVTTYDPAGLFTYGQTYYWKVVPYNAIGDCTTAPVWSFTVMANPTISTFPWLENFGTTYTYPPANWTNLTGLYGTETPIAGGSWASDDFANVVTTPVNISARLNIWTTSTKSWTVTPPIAIPATGYELVFDMALTTYSGTVSPTPGAQADDKFMVFIDDNPMMTSPTLLQEWNNTGSTYVYDTISNIGENHIFDLDSYTGTVYFGFYGESTVSGGDNNLFVDNVIVRETPAGAPDEVTITAPADGVTGLNAAGFNISWTPALTGGTPTYYAVYLSQEEGTIYSDVNFETTASSLNPATYADGPSDPIVFNYGERWYYTVEAFNGSGSAVVEPLRWFEIQDDPNITVFPYLQTFGDATFPPVLWTLATTGTFAWTRNASVNGYGAVENMGAARANFYSQNGTTPYDLITAPINLDGMAGLLSFDHAYATYAGENDRLEIMYSTNGTDYLSLQIFDGGATGPLNTGGTLTGTFVPTADQWATKTVNLPLGTTHVKFRAISAYGNDLYIDNIGLDQREVSLHDVAVMSITDLPALQTVGNTYVPKATVINLGATTETFNVTMSFAGYSSTQTVTSLATGVSSLVTFANWTPTAPGSYTATVEAVLAGDTDLTNNTATSAFNAWDTFWEYKANMPINSYLGSASNWYDSVTGNAHVITVAGNTASALNTEVYDYNVNLNTWTALPNIPASLRVHTSATVGNNVYVIGGSDASSVYQSTVYKYDLSTGIAGTWSSVAPLPVALGWVESASYGNYIYVAGGVDAASVISSAVYMYNTTTDTWTTATSLPAGVFGGAFAITGSKLVYAGGADLAVISNLVYVGTITADPAVINWEVSATRYPGLPAATTSISGNLMAQTAQKILKDSFNADYRVTHYPGGSMYRFDGATWGHDAIIVAGGSPSAAWTPVDPGVAYYYKPATDTWTQIAPLNTPVYGAYTSAVNTAGNTWVAVVASGGPSSVSTQTYTTTIIPPAIGTPVVSMVNGELTWTSIPGATHYTIFGSDDPYGTFTFITNLGSEYTSWPISTELGYPQARRFYVVTANNSGSRALSVKPGELRSAPASSGIFKPAE